MNGTPRKWTTADKITGVLLVGGIFTLGLVSGMLSAQPKLLDTKPEPPCHPRPVYHVSFYSEALNETLHEVTRSRLDARMAFHRIRLHHDAKPTLTVIRDACTDDFMDDVR